MEDKFEELFKDMEELLKKVFGEESVVKIMKVNDYLNSMIGDPTLHFKLDIKPQTQRVRKTLDDWKVNEYYMDVQCPYCGSQQVFYSHYGGLMMSSPRICSSCKKEFYLDVGRKEDEEGQI